MQDLEDLKGPDIKSKIEKKICNKIKVVNDNKLNKDYNDISERQFFNEQDLKEKSNKIIDM
jgi:hypothetical protein